MVPAPCLCLPGDPPLHSTPRNPQSTTWQFLHHTTGLSCFQQLFDITHGDTPVNDASIAATTAEIDGVTGTIRSRARGIVESYTSRRNPAARLISCAACGIREFETDNDFVSHSLAQLGVFMFKFSDAEAVRLDTLADSHPEKCDLTPADLRDITRAARIVKSAQHRDLMSNVSYDKVFSSYCHGDRRYHLHPEFVDAPMAPDTPLPEERRGSAAAPPGNVPHTGAGAAAPSGTGFEASGGPTGAPAVDATGADDSDGRASPESTDSGCDSESKAPPQPSAAPIPSPRPSRKRQRPAKLRAALPDPVQVKRTRPVSNGDAAAATASPDQSSSMPTAILCSTCSKAVATGVRPKDCIATIDYGDLRRVGIEAVRPLEWLAIAAGRTYLLVYKLSGANAGSGVSPTLRGQCCTFQQPDAPILLSKAGHQLAEAQKAAAISAHDDALKAATAAGGPAPPAIAAAPFTQAATFTALPLDLHRHVSVTFVGPQKQWLGRLAKALPFGSAFMPRLDVVLRVLRMLKYVGNPYYADVAIDDETQLPVVDEATRQYYADFEPPSEKHLAARTLARQAAEDAAQSREDAATDAAAAMRDEDDAEAQVRINQTARAAASAIRWSVSAPSPLRAASPRYVRKRAHIRGHVP